MYRSIRVNEMGGGGSHKLYQALLFFTSLPLNVEKPDKNPYSVRKNYFPLQTLSMY